MAFADLGDEQMVDEANASTGGFTLIGTPLSPSNKCYTKAEASAAYNLNADAMTIYASNQLLPKKAWVSGVTPVYTEAYYFVLTSGVSSAAGSCAVFNNNFLLYRDITGGARDVIVGDILYNDDNLSSPFNGNNLYWKQIRYDYSTSALQINSSGVVQSITPCASFTYGGAMTLNIPGYGNNVAPQPPGSGVISGYTLGSGITINNTSATEAVLFKSASLSNPYPIIVQQGSARLMQFVSTTDMYFLTTPGDGEVIPPSSSATWLAFGKNSGSGVVVLSLETQTPGGGRQQVFWSFTL